MTEPAEPRREERRAREAPAEATWSVQVGRALGIPIRIHFTFLLLLVWYAVDQTRRGDNPWRAMLFLVLVFACVALHELGHAAMALKFGVKTREIVLYPIGGIAALDRMPGGKAELLIALAGPAVNVALAGVLLAALAIFGGPPPASPDQMFAPGRILFPLLFANIMLVLFNLIPAFPMDGGRVLRAALSLAMPEVRATAIAAAVGQGIAVLFGAIGLFGGNLWLVFIALFVFLGATHENAFYQRRAAIMGHVAREAMIKRFETLAPQDSLGRATEVLLATHQQDFPVVDAWGRVAGVLPRSALMHALARDGKDAAVLEVMRRDVPMVAPGDNLEEILRKLQAEPVIPVLVVEDSRLVGMITLENLAEFIEIARRARLHPA
jgi:stage IV sporulation protein FB